MKHIPAQFIKQLANALVPTYHDQDAASGNAWRLLEHVTKKSRTQLMTQKELTLTEEQEQLLNQWIEQIIQEHKPIQYVIGSVPFLNIELLVAQPVLIPRPETEEWCNQLIETYKNSAHPAINGTILDLCTGSGCIALSLAKAFPHAHIYGTDISVEAIALAQQNAKHNDIHNVTFLLSDVFAQVPHIKFDLIAANPPYIAPDEYQYLSDSVINWEDKRALTSDDGGLAITEQIIASCESFLTYSDVPNLWMEIGYQQGQRASELFEKYHLIPTVYKDLNDNDRLITGKLKRE